MDKIKFLVPAKFFFSSKMFVNMLLGGHNRKMVLVHDIIKESVVHYIIKESAIIERLHAVKSPIEIIELFTVYSIAHK